MEMINMPKCKSCGAPIRWAKTKTGNNLPLDSRAHSMFILTGENDEKCEHVTVYIAHFATCPDASTHRKGLKDENQKSL
jgi:hypothetical protein